MQFWQVGLVTNLLAVLAFRNAWWLVTFCVLGALGCAALAIVGGRLLRSILFSLVAAPFAALRGLPWDELVREAMVLNKAFGERFHVRFESSGDRPERRVHADRKRLLQVMTNLLSNAAKFSPEGGVVEITLEERGESLRIGVHDRGPGIPEGFRGKIFGRFTQADSTATRQKGGTGLGLAICKRLIELMHGRIGFADRPGGGTTFWFELPRHTG